MRKKFAIGVLLTAIFISGCDDTSKGSGSGRSEEAIQMFKSEMGKGEHPPFTYEKLVFKPDQQDSGKVISGWICGDGSMERADKIFKFKVRGHVIKSPDISYVGDIAALIADSEMVKYDILYNQHCK